MTKTLLMILMVAGLLGPLPARCEDLTAPAAAPAEHHALGERIAQQLRRAGLSDELVVVVISALPVVELRGAVPVGHLFGMNPWKVYFLAVLGNMLPIPLILLFLKPVSEFCMRFAVGRRFFEWLFRRTRSKSAEIKRYETLGLAIFVAIPLPATGGWTGAAAAFMMGLKFWPALLSILLGVMIAGVIMTILALMGWWGAAIATIVLIGFAASAGWAWVRQDRRKAPLAGEIRTE